MAKRTRSATQIETVAKGTTTPLYEAGTLGEWLDYVMPDASDADWVPMWPPDAFAIGAALLEENRRLSRSRQRRRSPPARFRVSLTRQCVGPERRGAGNSMRCSVLIPRRNASASAKCVLLKYGRHGPFGSWTCHSSFREP